jgi:hypothetical protein
MLDPDRLVEKLSDLVPDLRSHLDANAYLRAQREDVLRWLATLAPMWTSTPEAMEYLIGTVRDAHVIRRVPRT